MERQNYRLPDDDYQRLLNAGKPVPYLIINGMGPTPPQERANAVWKDVGEKMGFVWDTVSPSAEHPSDPQWFTATPAPTKAMKEV